MVDIRHALGGIGVLMLVVLVATLGLAGDGPGTAPQPDEFTVNCAGNWSATSGDLANNATHICSDISGTDNATKTQFVIEAWGVTTPDQVQYREVVVLNNTVDHSVTVDWDELRHPNDANITIPANGQKEVIVRGFIYGTVYGDGQGFPYYFSFDAEANGIVQSLFDLVM